MASTTAVNTEDPANVCEFAVDTFAKLGWTKSRPLLKRLFGDVATLFGGKYKGYRAIDMSYHDLHHTMQATVCMLEILAGRHRAGAMPALNHRDAELGVMAVLLHDTGFLKRLGDPAGTGAKYTMIHERRSCDFAGAYLPSLGVSPEEIDDVRAAISCTGPNNRISGQSFRRPEAHVLACILVTSDYIAQMSAPDYPDKLQFLFLEFKEAFDHKGMPLKDRPYKTVRDLEKKTAEFWEKRVLPMLEIDAEGVYRYLSITGQPNLHLQAIEQNIARIRQRL